MGARDRQASGQSRSTTDSALDDLAAERSGRRQATPRAVRFFFPEYGLLEALLGVWLFAVVLTHVQTYLVGVVTTSVPTLSPDVFVTVLEGAPWLILAIVVVSHAHAQITANPRVVPAMRGTTREFADRRLSVRQGLLWLGSAAGGGLVVVTTWPTFERVLEQLFDLFGVVTTSGQLQGGIDPLLFGWIAVFVFAFSAFARGLDRLVVGLAGEGLYRLTRTETHAETHSMRERP